MFAAYMEDMLLPKWVSGNKASARRLRRRASRLHLWEQAVFTAFRSPRRYPRRSMPFAAPVPLACYSGERASRNPRLSMRYSGESEYR
jgi:hypothetical protein